MRGNELLEKMELIAPEYIEAADEAPEKTTRMSAFAQRPWMKWAVAAVLIIVIGVGTPVALNMMGAFRSDNLVAPGSNGGSGNSGFVAPIDGSSESGSSEEDSGSIVDEPSNSSAAPSNSSGRPGGSSTETPDVSSSGSDAPEQPEGDFVKENMPSVTYRINGEYKTFDYQSSTAVVDSGSSYVIDRYIGSDGSTVSKYADAEGLLRYDAGSVFDYVDSKLSEEKAIKKAKSIALNSDIALSGFEDSNTSVRFKEEKYYITLTAAEGNLDICLDSSGWLLHFVISV